MSMNLKIKILGSMWWNLFKFLPAATAGKMDLCGNVGVVNTTLGKESGN